MDGWLTQSNLLQKALTIFFSFFSQTCFIHSSFSLLNVCVFKYFFFNQIVRLLICGFVSFHFFFCRFVQLSKVHSKAAALLLKRLNKPKHIYINTNYRLCRRERGPLTKWLRSTPFPLCTILSCTKAWWLFRSTQTSIIR